MGKTVRIIHSGRAYASERPSKKRSESTIFLKTVYTSDGAMTLLSGCRDFTSYIHQITKYQADAWRKRTYVVIILRLLVLYKKFQTLLSDLRLDVTTAPWPFLTSGSSFSAPSPSSLGSSGSQTIFVLQWAQTTAIRAFGSFTC